MLFINAAGRRKHPNRWQGQSLLTGAFQGSSSALPDAEDQQTAAQPKRRPYGWSFCKSEKQESLF